MIGIIGAMKIELEEIKKQVSNLKEENKGIRTFYTGQIDNKDVVLVLAGIGKVNAAITTTKLLEEYDIDYIINIGVAGGQNGIKHKEVVISSEVVYHDVDVTEFSSYLHGQVPGLEPTFIADKTLIKKTTTILDDIHFDYKVGRIASGDQFVYSPKMVEDINEIYKDIYAIEMEAGAIAHTATVYNTPFIIFRSISDVLGDENQSTDFEEFVEQASKNASIVLSRLIKEL
jgi:adenosylhomocysteine nucleosidase